MRRETNPMASAWLDAASDLGIRVVHPYSFVDVSSGKSYETLGVFMPDFGSPTGTLLTCRFDQPDVTEAANGARRYRSSLNPKRYEPYDRVLYIETLNDWGWYGEGSPPPWYTGEHWTR